MKCSRTKGGGNWIQECSIIGRKTLYPMGQTNVGWIALEQQAGGIVI